MIFKNQYFIQQVMKKYRKYNEHQEQDVFVKSFDTISESDKNDIKNYLTLNAQEEVIFLFRFPYFHYILFNYLIAKIFRHVKKIFVPKRSYFNIFVLLTTNRIILKLPFRKLKCINRLETEGEDTGSSKIFRNGFLIPITFFCPRKKVKIKIYVESGQQYIAFNYALQFYFHPKFNVLN